MSFQPGLQSSTEFETLEECSMWANFPDNVLLHIFQYLPATHLVKAGQICSTWCRLAGDDYLWRELLYRKWKINRAVRRRPGASSWRSEYRRLVYCAPTELSQVLKVHTDQVLHVVFSHGGLFFATTSKDGFIKVWNASNPVTLKYEEDMKLRSWRYTQFSQFNSDDSLLLVSGVHCGEHTTFGDIAVFSMLDQFAILTTVRNKPYDIFGAWFDTGTFISGDLMWREHLTSCTLLNVNDSFQTSTGKAQSLLYKFCNLQASSIRTVMIASPRKRSSGRYAKRASPSDSKRPSYEDLEWADLEDLTEDGADEVRRSSSEDLDARWLIFTCGSETYTPHQVGFKRIEASDVTSEDGKLLERPDDEIDHVFEMHGHIIGMTLSPDHRYLYINCRAWPKGYRIKNPLDPPPIAKQIDIHVIDLITMTEVVSPHQGHNAFTSNEECFFIFLDVSENYIASGAEDKHGYLWDRHYGICLQKFCHDDVVNCVAFSTRDPELLVSVSDDFTFKVWRSRRRINSIRDAAAVCDTSIKRLLHCSGDDGGTLQ